MLSSNQWAVYRVLLDVEHRPRSYAFSFKREFTLEDVEKFTRGMAMWVFLVAGLIFGKLDVGSSLSGAVEDLEVDSRFSRRLNPFDSALVDAADFSHLEVPHSQSRAPRA